MSIVRENLMTRPGYAPYCGGPHCPTAPRTVFDGDQFKCPRCGWRSEFPADFIAEYKAKWRKSAYMEGPRIVSRFSCGAASAVATKLVLAEYGATRDVQIINAFIEQEHPDNRRFLADCEKWFGRSIAVLRDTKYNASTVEVFRRRMYMAGRNGAPCTKFLKRELMDAYGKPNDVWVLGYTAEEQSRLDAFLDANGGRRVLTPLIDRGLGKADCLAMVQRAGIELPMMYRMGYQNANCIGCVKGGEGYWNKIRRDFPAQFEELALVQELIGPSAYLFRDRKTGERYSLRDLPPNKGRYQDEPDIECGAMCELAERDLAAV